MAKGLGDANNAPDASYLARVWNNIENFFVYGSTYQNPPMPPTVGSTVGGQPIPAVPASGAAANATIDAIIGQQSSDWKDNTQSFFDSLNTPEPTTGLPWWQVILIGVGGVVLVGVLANGKR